MHSLHVYVSILFVVDCIFLLTCVGEARDGNYMYVGTRDVQ